MSHKESIHSGTPRYPRPRPPGIALFLCAALMLYVETRKSLPRALAWLILAGNVVWVIGSIAVLFVTSPSSSTAACAGPPA